MDGNKDEALRCLQFAKRAIESRDFHKGLRMAERAQRMFPTSEGATYVKLCSFNITRKTSNTVGESAPPTFSATNTNVKSSSIPTVLSRDQIGEVGGTREKRSDRNASSWSGSSNNGVVFEPASSYLFSACTSPTRPSTSEVNNSNAFSFSPSSSIPSVSPSSGGGCGAGGAAAASTYGNGEVHQEERKHNDNSSHGSGFNRGKMGSVFRNGTRTERAAAAAARAVEQPSRGGSGSGGGSSGGGGAGAGGTAADRECLYRPSSYNNNSNNTIDSNRNKNVTKSNNNWNNRRSSLNVPVRHGKSDNNNSSSTNLSSSNSNSNSSSISSNSSSSNSNSSTSIPTAGTSTTSPASTTTTTTATTNTSSVFPSPGGSNGGPVGAAAAAATVSDSTRDERTAAGSSRANHSKRHQQKQHKQQQKQQQQQQQQQQEGQQQYQHQPYRRAAEAMHTSTGNDDVTSSSSCVNAASAPATGATRGTSLPKKYSTTVDNASSSPPVVNSDGRTATGRATAEAAAAVGAAGAARGGGGVGSRETAENHQRQSQHSHDHHQQQRQQQKPAGDVGSRAFGTQSFSGQPYTSSTTPPVGAAASSSSTSTSATTTTSSSNIVTTECTYTAEQVALCTRVLTTQCYYQTLGLEKGASEDAIKRAYKKLALLLHPDKNRAPHAEEAFKKVSKVSQCLLDPERRKRYDEGGQEAETENQRVRHRQHQQEEGITPEEFLQMFFGFPVGSSTFHTRNAQFFSTHRHQQRSNPEHASSTYYLMQVLPMALMFFIMFLGNLFSSPPSQPVVPYSFTPVAEYRLQRLTRYHSVRFYVSPYFRREYPDESEKLRELEMSIELKYYHEKCQKEKEELSRQLSAAHYYRASALLLRSLHIEGYPRQQQHQQQEQ